MATNNIKPFAIGNGANVTSQADYESLSELLTGFQSGKASSAQINKALRQSSFVASVLAQFISNAAGVDVLDNGNATALLNNFIAALKANGANDFLQKSSNLTDVADKTVALSTLGGAPLASPTFTGTPKGPTAAAGTNNTQLATTAFAQGLAGLMLKTSNNFSEIAAAGPTAINSALSNLTIAIRNSMTFTYTTTWTCPDGVTTVYVDACAAGGGGGYSASGNTGAGGGGGGQAVIRRAITVVPGTVYTITIGAPGTGGTSSSVNGTQGGNTAFGSLLTLVGGYGGLSNGTAGASGGDGGVAATAGVRTSSMSFGGAGGGSLFGPGGAGGNGAMFGSVPGMFGGGGGGGAAGDGARGAYGFMRIWW